MAKMTRIADDLHAEFVDESERTGTPLARIVDRQLRRAKAIDAIAYPAEVVSEGPLERRDEPRVASFTPAEPEPECQHPVGRRIGDLCATCGRTVPKASR